MRFYHIGLQWKSSGDDLKFDELSLTKYCPEWKSDTFKQRRLTKTENDAVVLNNLTIKMAKGLLGITCNVSRQFIN